jgi:hypothetical protein
VVQSVCVCVHQSRVHFGFHSQEPKSVSTNRSLTLKLIASHRCTQLHPSLLQQAPALFAWADSAYPNLPYVLRQKGNGHIRPRDLSITTKILPPPSPSLLCPVNTYTLKHVSTPANEEEERSHGLAWSRAVVWTRWEEC